MEPPSALSMAMPLPTGLQHTISTSDLGIGPSQHHPSQAQAQSHPLPPLKKRKTMTKSGSGNGTGVGGGSGTANATASGSGTSHGSVRKTDGVGGSADGSDESKEAKKRPQSCDVCRARKVKCVKPPEAARCEGCVTLDQRCEYTHERKKPGPANSYARKPTPPQPLPVHPPPPSNGFIPIVPPAHPSHVRSYSHGATPVAPVFPFDHMVPPHWTPPNLHAVLGSNSAPQHSDTGQPSHPPPHPHSHAHTLSLQTDHGGSSVDIHASPFISSTSGLPNTFTLDPSWLPISPNSLLHPQPGEPDSASEDSPMGRWAWISGMDDIWDSQQPIFVQAQPVQQQHENAEGGVSGVDGSGAGSGSGMGNNTVAPLGSGSGNGPGRVDLPRPSVQFDLKGLADMSVPVRRVEEKCQRLEDIAPFSTITRILHAYHAHLYPLMPVLHWPTFSQQLVAREDERSDSWRAFVLSLVAYSIIQLPRSALHFLPVRELRRLHHKCHAESKRLQNKKWRDVRLIDVATLYCDHIYLGSLGRTNVANVTLAEAIRLAQVLNLHDERLGDPIFDVVERETRRRVFWLLYGSDRTITALTSVPMHIQDCDLCLPLPLSIDDSLLTTAGAFPQPPHTIPVLAGFHFGARLFRLLGSVLTAHRTLVASSFHPSTDPFPMLGLAPLPVQIRPSQQFFDELERILSDLPGPLQLVNPTMNGMGTGPISTPSTSSGASQGEGSRDPAFATCRANLLVSQAMVRFAIRQYAKAVGEDEGTEGREWAERDVLSLLESMSSESLAANGESLRRKVLFVASSLLEKYPSTTEGHSYVSDFLAVYTRISEEQHASLLEDSAAPSRETSPFRALGLGGSEG